MDYIDATIEMKLKEDGNPKFEIVLPHIVEWTCSIDASNRAVIRKDVQYWDEIDDFWKFKDIMRDSGSSSPFNVPYIRGVKKHDADYVFDEDKSVKWNRNAVIEYNKAVDSIQAKNKKFQKNADDIFNSCVIACIRSVFIYAGLKINTNEINYIIAKAKERSYDFPYELIDQIENYCDFYVELLEREKTMPEICVKSFAFQYEKQFIKEVKNYVLPYNIYNNLVKEINEEPPLNISDYLINTELNYTLNFPPHSGDDGNWYKCGDGNWYKWGNIKVKEDRTLKMILSALFESCTWRNHYLHVYWDYDKSILTFEEEYGDKYEN